MNRFWEKVKKSDGCWEWQSVMKPNGYGWFMWNRKAWSAHRVSWILTNGKILGGMCVLHQCDNRRCVRPSHLSLGTQSENLRDMWARGRHPDPVPHFWKRGEENHGAKLNWEKVKQIRSSSESDRKLARLHGVSYSVINDVKRGVSWRDVPSKEG